MLQAKNKDKAPTENVKQQKQERINVLHNTIRPHENHTVFEYNIKTKELRVATLEEESRDIHWFKAVAGDFTRKRVVIRQENCIYDAALNIENFKKILKRKHNIIVE